MTEQFYIIAARYKDGEWNKFAKAYDLPGLNAIPFFYEKSKAEEFLNNNLNDVREFFSVFEIVIDDKHVKKVIQ